MKICIVAFSNHLECCLSALNPNVDIAAIIVDNPKAAKLIIKKFNLSEDVVQPYFNLEECVKNLDYDYIVVSLRWSMFSETVINDLKALNLPRNKFVNLWDLDKPEHVSALTVLMNFYTQNSTAFNTFITGNSQFVYGIDINQLSMPTINFSRGSQDLYYDYLIAKKILQQENIFDYAIIGLSLYSFNWDVSQSFQENWRLLQWYLYFRDLHNYWINVENYTQLFNEKFINGGFLLSLEVDFNDVYKEKNSRKMSIFERLNTKKVFDRWNKKYFPKTVEENKAILNNYLKLCEENKIEPVIVLPPIMKECQHLILKDRSDEFYSTINEILKNHSSAKFVDATIFDDLIEDDFCDCYHLNKNGAEKFSQMLSQQIFGY